MAQMRYLRRWAPLALICGLLPLCLIAAPTRALPGKWRRNWGIRSISRLLKKTGR